jgi:muramoyltetrapeptide carboxypeptidase
VLLEGLEALVPGRARGPLVGGNLEVFSRLVGTPYMPDVTGAILFIEDLGERPYRIDRLVTHLDLAGVFSAVEGVVVGDFSSCVEPEPTRASSPTAAEVLVERLGRLAIPVAIGGLFGHGTRNLALPYGCACELDAFGGTLTALEGVVT